jgi:hypothetical protein
VPTTAAAEFRNVQDQCVPVLAVSRAVSAPDCAAVMTGVAGVADATPGTASAAPRAAEAAQATSHRTSNA